MNESASPAFDIQSSLLSSEAVKNSNVPLDVASVESKYQPFVDETAYDPSAWEKQFLGMSQLAPQARTSEIAGAISEEATRKIIDSNPVDDPELIAAGYSKHRDDKFFGQAVNGAVASFRQTVGEFQKTLRGFGVDTPGQLENSTAGLMAQLAAPTGDSIAQQFANDPWGTLGYHLGSSATTVGIFVAPSMAITAIMPTIGLGAWAAEAGAMASTGYKLIKGGKVLLTTAERTSALAQSLTIKAITSSPMFGSMVALTAQSNIDDLYRRGVGTYAQATFWGVMKSAVEAMVMSVGAVGRLSGTAAEKALLEERGKILAELAKQSTGGELAAVESVGQKLLSRMSTPLLTTGTTAFNFVGSVANDTANMALMSLAGQLVASAATGKNELKPREWMEGALSFLPFAVVAGAFHAGSKTRYQIAKTLQKPLSVPEFVNLRKSIDPKAWDDGIEKPFKAWSDSIIAQMQANKAKGSGAFWDTDPEAVIGTLQVIKQLVAQIWVISAGKTDALKVFGDLGVKLLDMSPEDNKILYNLFKELDQIHAIKESDPTKYAELKKDWDARWLAHNKKLGIEEVLDKTNDENLKKSEEQDQANVQKLTGIKVEPPVDSPEAKQAESKTDSTLTDEQRKAIDDKVVEFRNRRDAARPLLDEVLSKLSPEDLKDPVKIISAIDPLIKFRDDYPRTDNLGFLRGSIKNWIDNGENVAEALAGRAGVGGFDVSAPIAPALDADGKPIATETPSSGPAPMAQRSRDVRHTKPKFVETAPDGTLRPKPEMEEKFNAIVDTIVASASSAKGGLRKLLGHTGVINAVEKSGSIGLIEDMPKNQMFFDDIRAIQDAVMAKLHAKMLGMKPESNPREATDSDLQNVKRDVLVTQNAEGAVVVSDVPTAELTEKDAGDKNVMRFIREVRNAFSTAVSRAVQGMVKSRDRKLLQEMVRDQLVFEISNQVGDVFNVAIKGDTPAFDPRTAMEAMGGDESVGEAAQRIAPDAYGFEPVLRYMQKVITREVFGRGGIRSSEKTELAMGENVTPEERVRKINEIKQEITAAVARHAPRMRQAFAAWRDITEGRYKFPEYQGAKQMEEAAQAQAKAIAKAEGQDAELPATPKDAKTLYVTTDEANKLITGRPFESSAKKGKDTKWVVLLKPESAEKPASELTMKDVDRIHVVQKGKKPFEMTAEVRKFFDAYSTFRGEGGSAFSDVAVANKSSMDPYSAALYRLNTEGIVRFTFELASRARMLLAKFAALHTKELARNFYIDMLGRPVTVRGEVVGVEFPESEGVDLAAEAKDMLGKEGENITEETKALWAEEGKTDEDTLTARREARDEAMKRSTKKFAILASSADTLAADMVQGVFTKIPLMLAKIAVETKGEIGPGTLVDRAFETLGTQVKDRETGEMRYKEAQDDNVMTSLFDIIRNEFHNRREGAADPRIEGIAQVLVDAQPIHEATRTDIEQSMSEMPEMFTKPAETGDFEVGGKQKQAMDVGNTRTIERLSNEQFIRVAAIVNLLQKEANGEIPPFVLSQRKAASLVWRLVSAHPEFADLMARMGRSTRRGAASVEEMTKFAKDNNIAIDDVLSAATMLKILKSVEETGGAMSQADLSQRPEHEVTVTLPKGATKTKEKTVVVQGPGKTVSPAEVVDAIKSLFSPSQLRESSQEVIDNIMRAEEEARTKPGTLRRMLNGESSPEPRASKDETKSEENKQQVEEDKVYGWYSPEANRNMIYLTNHARPETILHEFMHHLMDKDLMPPDVKDTLNKAYNNDQEKIADSIILYMREGLDQSDAKDNPELAAAFKWIASTTSKAALDINTYEMNGETKAFFDKVIKRGNLTTPDVLEAARALIAVVSNSNAVKATVPSPVPTEAADVRVKNQPAYLRDAGKDRYRRTIMQQNGVVPVDSVAELANLLQYGEHSGASKTEASEAAISVKFAGGKVVAVFIDTSKIPDVLLPMIAYQLRGSGFNLDHVQLHGADGSTKRLSDVKDISDIPDEVGNIGIRLFGQSKNDAINKYMLDNNIVTAARTSVGYLMKKASEKVASAWKAVRIRGLDEDSVILMFEDGQIKWDSKKGRTVSEPTKIHAIIDPAKLSPENQGKLELLEEKSDVKISVVMPDGTLGTIAQYAKAVPTSAIPRAQIAYHGTPNRYQPEPGYPHGRIRLDFARSGEGSAYRGEGFYIGEQEGTARSYASSEVLFGGVSTRGAYSGDNPFSSLEADLKYANWQLKNAIAKSIAWSGVRELPEHIKTPEDKAKWLEWGLNREQADGGPSNIELIKKGKWGAGMRNIDIMPEFDKLMQDVRTGKVDIGLSGGHVLELDVPDNIVMQLQDWDKPISKDLGSRIANKLMELYPDHKENPWVWHLKRWAEDIRDPEVVGMIEKGYITAEQLRSDESLTKRRNEAFDGSVFGSFYMRIAEELGSKKEASKLFLALGIPGNKFLDKFSRDGTSSTKTYNYVIWDQAALDKISILKRNGEWLDEQRRLDQVEPQSGFVPQAMITNRRITQEQKSKYADAMQMFRDGVRPDEVFKKTGWWYGIDGVMKRELDRTGLALGIPNLLHIYENNDKGIKIGTFFSAPLYVHTLFSLWGPGSGLMRFPDFENTFPELAKRMGVVFNHGMSPGTAAYDPVNKMMHIPDHDVFKIKMAKDDATRSSLAKNILANIAHELTHAAQEEDGMSQGAGYETIKMIVDKLWGNVSDGEKYKHLSQLAYATSFGEAEARTEARRLAFSDERRMSEHPLDTMRQMLIDEGLLPPGVKIHDILTHIASNEPGKESVFVPSELNKDSSNFWLPRAQRDKDGNDFPPKTYYLGFVDRNGFVKVAERRKIKENHLILLGPASNLTEARFAIDMTNGKIQWRNTPSQWERRLALEHIAKTLGKNANMFQHISVTDTLYGSTGANDALVISNELGERLANGDKSFSVGDVMSEQQKLEHPSIVDKRVEIDYGNEESGIEYDADNGIFKVHMQAGMTLENTKNLLASVLQRSVWDDMHGTFDVTELLKGDGSYTLPQSNKTGLLTTSDTLLNNQDLPAFNEPNPLFQAKRRNVDPVADEALRRYKKALVFLVQFMERQDHGKKRSREDVRALREAVGREVFGDDWQAEMSDPSRIIKRDGGVEILEAQTAAMLRKLDIPVDDPLVFRGRAGMLANEARRTSDLLEDLYQQVSSFKDAEHVDPSDAGGYSNWTRVKDYIAKRASKIGATTSSIHGIALFLDHGNPDGAFSRLVKDYFVPAVQRHKDRESGYYNKVVSKYFAAYADRPDLLPSDGTLPYAIGTVYNIGKRGDANPGKLMKGSEVVGLYLVTEGGDIAHDMKNGKKVYRNKTVRKIMRSSNQITEEMIQDAKQLVDTDPHLSRLTKVISDMYAEVWPELNRVHMDLNNGTPIGKITEGKYMPLMWNFLDESVKSSADVISNFEGQGTPQGKQRINPTFTEERGRSASRQSMPMLNAWEVMRVYFSHADNYIAKAGTMKMLDAILSDPRLNDIVMNKFKTNDFLQNMHENIRREMTLTGRLDRYRDSDRKWAEIRQNISRATLGLNPSPIMKQWSSIGPAMTMLPMSSLVTLSLRVVNAYVHLFAFAGKKLARRFLGVNKESRLTQPSAAEFAWSGNTGFAEMLRNEPILRRRTIDINLTQIEGDMIWPIFDKAFNVDASQTIKRFWHNFKLQGLEALRVTDAGVTYAIWQTAKEAQFAKLMSKPGMTEATAQTEAMKFATEVVRRSNDPSSHSEMSNFQRESEIIKALQPFTGFAFKQWQLGLEKIALPAINAYLNKDGGEFARLTSGAGAIAKEYNTIAWACLFPAFALGAMARGRMQQDKDELFQDILAYNLGAMPLVGSFMSTYIGGHDANLFGTLWSETGTDIAKSITDTFSSKMRGERLNIWDNQKQLWKAVAAWKGIPVYPLRTLIRAMDLMNNKVESGSSGITYVTLGRDTTRDEIKRKQLLARKAKVEAEGLINFDYNAKK